MIYECVEHIYELKTEINPKPNIVGGALQKYKLQFINNII